MNFDQLSNFFNRAMQPIKNRLMLMIGRAVIAAVNDGTGIQQVQISVLAGESMDKVERFQNWGFTGNPPAGAEAILVAIGANRDNLAIVALDHREKRLKGLAAGESAMYDDKGNYIWMKTSGNQEVKLKKLKIENDAEELITVLDDWMKAVEEAYVMTAMGPQQFMPADIAKFVAIRERLESFKV